MNDQTTRDEVFDYLDDLRNSGVTNMFGAAPYLMEEFGFEKREASRWLVEWMQTFGERRARSAQMDDSEE
jgi:hypothetical protein